MMLPDGRKLAWSEWGPEEGRSVLFCTGAGMSGALGFGEEFLQDLNLRLIAVDRPGLGGSTHHPDKSLRTWSLDIAAFLDAHGCRDTLAVGFSQGAPFALALAAENLVRKVALVSGQDDLGHPDFEGVLDLQVAGMIAAARKDPQGFEQDVASMASDSWLWDMIMAMSAECDRAVYSGEAFSRLYRTSLAEGFSQGTAGYARDLAIALEEWTFDPGSIEVPVAIWYGLRDSSPVHSPDFGRSLAARLPRSTRIVDEVEGGSILWTRSRDILNDLVTMR